MSDKSKKKLPTKKLPETNMEMNVAIERIGSHIYEFFRQGMITFEECQGSLELLEQSSDGQLWLGMPIEGEN